jgi:hypothetical protein
VVEHDIKDDLQTRNGQVQPCWKLQNVLETIAVTALLQVLLLP